MKRGPGPIRECKACGENKPHHARGMCHPCYRKTRGRCDGPTGNPGGKGHACTPDAVASRIEDYVLVRADPRIGRAEAARRVGISYRTALRYENRLAAAGGA